MERHPPNRGTARAFARAAADRSRSVPQPRRLGGKAAPQPAPSAQLRVAAARSRRRRPNGPVAAARTGAAASSARQPCPELQLRAWRSARLRINLG